MKKYDFNKIEKKWQNAWDKSGIYKAKDSSKKQKFYALIEFPYPSGDGLHVGHIRSNAAMDIIARKRRMEGYNVLYPIGWDAFGLPTENYAIKTGIHPITVTKKNTDNFRKQLKSVGFSFDWSREINTTDPEYYKWTQWMFLQFFKHGLAYKDSIAINWCPKDKIGLANEEAVGGICERCGTPVEKRQKEQWMIRITSYAEKLLAGLDTVDYLPKIKAQQINWIGRSEGALIKFALHGIFGQPDDKHSVEVFTTRPDTLFGVTFVAVSAELAEKWLRVGWQANDEVKKYTKKILSERVKGGDDRKEVEKTGVATGLRAVNPANNNEVPVWVVNYVLGDVGTGAVMAVPAQDERDFEFAQKYKLLVRHVIDPMTGSSQKNPEEKKKVIAIVENAKGEILTINWGPGLGGRLFIGGSVEKGEELLEAAKREVLEETGYSNLVLRNMSEEEVHHEYFAHSKKKAFIAHTKLFYFYLEDENKTAQNLEDNEKGKFSVEWTTKENVRREVVDPLHRYAFDKFIDSKIFTGKGILRNSGKFDGMDSEKAKIEITKFVDGKMTTKYKLRDWVFSRQRYWGEPIPIIKCEQCGYVPIPEKELPLKLPNIKEYKPRDDGESPLASVSKWVNVKCPTCKGPARRETDTMPNWAGSSWYFLRYVDSKNKKVFADAKKLEYFMPVDWYNGGMEHTTLHLLYSRFWNQFLFDYGYVPTSEPYKKRTAHGLILAEGGVKMSKSKGNVVNPDAIVKAYGADSLRLYEMFMGPFDQAIAWDSKGIEGVSRFLGKVWRIATEKKIVVRAEDNALQTLLHKTIKKVTEDIEVMGFNTAISALMIFINECQSREVIPQDLWKSFLLLLAPFAPHVTEELWQSVLGYKKSIHVEPWPKYESKFLQDEEATIVVQINGKVRGSFTVAMGADENDVRLRALSDDRIKLLLENATIKKVIFVPNRLINFVI